MVNSEDGPTIAEVRRLAGEALRATEFADKETVLERLAAAASELGDPAGAAGARDMGGPELADAVDLVDVRRPGRPAAVRLVAPRELARRTWGTESGRVATLHALAHIEANAVNLALDAAHRFAAMPAKYYVDWTRVALEEFGHFRMLESRLAAHEIAYGDLGCHDGLWDMAVSTATDARSRMALVPMVFEARGLDVTPGLIERFRRHGDDESADVLEVVLADEVGHVAVGVEWFRFLCDRDGVDRSIEFERLVAEASLKLVPPFNHDARRRAGFDMDDLRRWEMVFTGTQRNA